MSNKVNPPRSIAAESDQTIVYLERISELLKHQRRHFDDAVVMHCIHLVREYLQDNLQEPSRQVPASSGAARRS